MKKIVLDLQTYKAKKTFNFSLVLSFFHWTSYHAISGLIKTLVFVFIILLTEPQRFTFHSSSRKNTKLCKPQNIFFLFWYQRQRPENISQKVNGGFCQAIEVTGRPLFLALEIRVVSHSTLFQLTVGRRFNLMGEAVGNYSKNS